MLKLQSMTENVVDLRCYPSTNVGLPMMLHNILHHNTTITIVESYTF